MVQWVKKSYTVSSVISKRDTRSIHYNSHNIHLCLINDGFQLDICLHNHSNAELPYYQCVIGIAMGFITLHNYDLL